MFFVHSSGMFFLLLSLSLFICDNAWHPPNHRPRRQQSPLAASSGQSWHQPIQQHCLPLLHSSWPSASPRSSPHPAILETHFAIKAELFETVAQHPEWFWSDKLKNLKDAVYRATQ